MDTFTTVLLIISGLLAGFVDSIAGGGGLITVPVFSLILGPGATAIGTNKIVGVVATGVALFLYRRAGHVSLRQNWRIALYIGLGAALGSLASRFISTEIYKWFLIFISPLMLFIVFHKDIWIRESIESESTRTNRFILYSAILACGFYDGIAGPGGGTLMFLSLFTLARLPLLRAMATAKVANLASASFALVSYVLQGRVVWKPGLLMAVGIALGATLGVTLATRRATTFTRMALLIVSLLLIVRLLIAK